MHALWTLHGLGSLPEDAVIAALDHDNADLREQALRLAEGFVGKSEKMRRAVVKLGDDPCPRVRFTARQRRRRVAATRTGWHAFVHNASALPSLVHIQKFARAEQGLANGGPRILHTLSKLLKHLHFVARRRALIGQREGSSQPALERFLSARFEAPGHGLGALQHERIVHQGQRL